MAAFDPAKVEAALFGVLGGRIQPERLEGGEYQWTLGDRKWTARPYSIVSVPRAKLLVCTPVMPGVYQDQDGVAHFSLADLLRLVELVDTPENRSRLIQTIEDGARGEGITVEWNPEDGR